MEMPRQSSVELSKMKEECQLLMNMEFRASYFSR